MFDKEILRSPIYDYKGKIEFISYGSYVDNEEDVNIFLEAIRRNYTIDNNKNNYGFGTTFPFALRLCPDSNSDIIEYYEDDDEIGCGNLLMNTLIRRNLENCIIVVCCDKKSCFSPDFIQLETVKPIRDCSMDVAALLSEQQLFMKSSASASISLISKKSTMVGSVCSNSNINGDGDNNNQNIIPSNVYIREKVIRDSLNMKSIIPSPDAMGLEVYLAKELEEAKERKELINAATVAPFKTGPS